MPCPVLAGRRRVRRGLGGVYARREPASSARPRGDVPRATRSCADAGSARARGGSRRRWGSSGGRRPETTGRQVLSGLVLFWIHLAFLLLSCQTRVRIPNGIRTRVSGSSRWSPTGWESLTESRRPGWQSGDHFLDLFAENTAEGLASSSRFVSPSSSSAPERHCGRSRDAFPATHLPTVPCRLWAHPSCRPAAKLHRDASVSPQHQRTQT
jgi:hypothetical protein